MDKCAHIHECDFYQGKLDIAPLTTEFIKTMYCHKGTESCAKYCTLARQESIDELEEMLSQSVAG